MAFSVRRVVQPSSQSIYAHYYSKKKILLSYRSPPISNTPSPWPPLSIFCLEGPAHPGHLRAMESHNTWSSVPGSLHAVCTAPPHGAHARTFCLLPSDLPLHGETTFVAHSSVSGHHCFRVLALLNTVTVNV